MLDFQTALTRLAPTTGGRDPVRSFRPGGAERACLEVLRQSAGFRSTAAVQHSWCARRAVNAGLLALSIMHDDARRRLLSAWIRSGGGTSSLFAAEADALLEFIAEQLPDPSPELAVCRFMMARAPSRPPIVRCLSCGASFGEDAMRVWCFSMANPT